MLLGALIDIASKMSGDKGDVADDADSEKNVMCDRIPLTETESQLLQQCPLPFKDLFTSTAPASNTTLEQSATPIYSGFRLPIEYLDQTELYTVSNVVTNDLELSSLDASFCLFPGVISSNIYSGGCKPDMVSSALDPTPNSSIYEHFIRPTNVFSGEMTREIQKRYTTNTRFLEETQLVLADTTQYTSAMESYMKDEMPAFAPNAETFLQLWKDTKEDAEFLDKYSYLEWPILEHLNHSDEFLQVFSMMNILSPVFSLLIPLLFLVFPFVLLRLKQIEITMEQYIETLRDIAKHHFIGKALSSDFTLQGIGYLVITAGLYFMQTYQNVNSCIRYYRNITKMNEHLELMRDHIKHSIRRMETFVRLHASKPTYREFCNITETHITQLTELYDNLSGITPFAVSLYKVGSIGYMLKWYYQLHANPLYEKSIRYSIGFGAYMDVLVGIAYKCESGHLGKATFVETNELVFRDQYYPTHNPGTCVKNTCDASRNIIITGVNASGKTTFLKTTAINILMTQQFGVGFYSSASIQPFTHIHSYLNIPDTSGRDSLFQAESRRCKEILDAIESSNTRNTANTDRHYVLFDELYSGTNPEEATKSAVSLLRYLSKFTNVRFMLTTHYLKVCKKFRKSDKISNYKMDVKVNENGNIRYIYKLKKGISKIQGGVEILKQMNYPEEILRDIRNA